MNCICITSKIFGRHVGITIIQNVVDKRNSWNENMASELHRYYANYKSL
jgi:hypothetical protein